MCNVSSFRKSAGRALCLFALASSALVSNAHAQASNWQSVASACTPTSLATLTTTTINAILGSVQAPLGPNPPKLYTCNVLDSFASVNPTWTTLELQYFDPVGGAVKAELYSRNKGNGATAFITGVSSVAAIGVANVAVALPALNFAANSYHVVLTMFPKVGVQVRAHMVRLDE